MTPKQQAAAKANEQSKKSRLVILGQIPSE